MCSKTEALLFLLLVLVKQKYAQPTAIITPRGYNASLDPEASFTFQCYVTGADDVQWFIDGLPSSRQDNINRGISESGVDGATGSLRRSLTIVRTITNRMTTILCTANTFSSPGVINSSVSSEQVLFKIQGLLDAPSNLMLSEADNWQHIRRLSNWNESLSLDITDIDPDISHYEVCYNLVNANKSQCVRVSQTEFSFPYVNVPLLFTVSAVNVVGEGNSSSVLHDGNGCTNTTGLNSTCPECTTGNCPYKGDQSNKCNGMCGLGCQCWSWVCGDCCVHQGCLDHDNYCARDGYLISYNCTFGLLRFLAVLDTL